MLLLDRLKDIFSNEWGYELEFPPGYSGRSNSNTRKAVRCLNASWPSSQVPLLNRSTGFAMWTVFFMHLPLGLSATGLHSFQMFSPAFLIRWSQKTDLPAGRAMSQPTCLCGSGRGTLRATFRLPNGLPSWEELGATLSLGVDYSPCLCLAHRDPPHLVLPFLCGQSTLLACLSTGAPLEPKQWLLPAFWSDGAGRHSPQ